MNRAALGFFGFLAFGFLAFACNDTDTDCGAEKKDNWALSLQLEPAGDGTCPFEGSFEFEGEEDVLECGPVGSACNCSGGNAYGRYTVTITNTVTDATDRAVLDVSSGPWPSCTTTDAVERFAPLDSAGGAGGAR